MVITLPIPGVSPCLQSPSCLCPSYPSCLCPPPFPSPWPHSAHCRYGEAAAPSVHCQTLGVVGEANHDSEL